MENAATAKTPKKRGPRKVRAGVVVSDKMDKTVVVRMERTKMHSKYKKYIRVWKKVKVHDQENVCKTGDRVQIMETRPLSKEKRWRILNIIKKAE